MDNTVSRNPFLDILRKKSMMTTPTKQVQTKSLEKLYLSVPTNFGKYRVIPFPNVLDENGFPYDLYLDTKEINIPKEYEKDGVKKLNDRWIHILPKEAFKMKDSTGRIVSSLSAADENLIDQAHRVWRELYGEMGGFKKQADRSQQEKDRLKVTIRTKNYTIFNAFCIDKLENGGRSVTRQNFSCVFIVPAKGFINTLEKNIDDTTMVQEDISWTDKIYNNNESSRGGYVMFSCALGTGTAIGYDCSVTHVIKPHEFELSEEELTGLRRSPLENFLSWQAKREDNVDPCQRHLFNPDLYKEAIDYMTNKLAYIRTNGTVNMTVSQAQNITNSAAMGNQPVMQGTVDPMLGSNTSGVNMNNVVANNNDPFKNPPVAHVDPLTGAPLDMGGGNSGFGQQRSAAPFSNPFASYNKGSEGEDNGDLPF